MLTESKVKLIVQFTDPDLAIHDREAEAELLYAAAKKIIGVGFPNYVIDPSGTTKELRMGVELPDVDGDRIRTVLGFLCDRIAHNPIETQIELLHRTTRLQVKTRDPKDLAAVIQLAERLLPAPYIFQGMAEHYAQQGEISPAAYANLQWLQHQLDLDAEACRSIIAKALGPYHTRQERLQAYQHVLEAEFQRQYPLSEQTQSDLQRLADNLKLQAQDVAPLHENYAALITAEAEQQHQAEEEAQRITQLQQATLLQMEQEEQAERQRQANADHYKQLVQEVLTHTLFPTEFDRGRLEQARLIWGLDAETVRAAEHEATNSLYGQIDSAVGVDYTRLRQLLWTGNWLEADQETERVILLATSKDMCPLTLETIATFPCIDLITIDSLWRRYSNGQFGFSAQLQTYHMVNRDADDFLRKVDWQGSFGWGHLLQVKKTYRDLQFTLEAPTGHLPTWRWVCITLESDYTITSEIVDAFFARVEQCIPTTVPPSSLVASESAE